MIRIQSTDCKLVPLDFPYAALLSSANPLKVVAQRAKKKAERECIDQVLQLCNNDYSEASKMLNIRLSSLYRKLKESD
jgi:DNA-binding NtrC family response regulator